MTAPTTITVTGTWYDASNTLATGTVTFAPLGYGPNNANVIDAKPIVATLSSGAISQVLVNLAGGYRVTESITGAPVVSYTIAGTSGSDLSAATRAVQTGNAPTSGAGAFSSSVTATAAHGLGFTPDINRIRITPKALPASGQWYLSAVDGTNITVTCATSGSWAFAWSYV